MNDKVFQETCDICVNQVHSIEELYVEIDRVKCINSLLHDKIIDLQRENENSEDKIKELHRENGRLQMINVDLASKISRLKLERRLKDW